MCCRLAGSRLAAESSRVHERAGAEQAGLLGVGKQYVYVVARRGPRGERTRYLEDGGDPGSVVRSAWSVGRRVVVGDEDDVSG
jgi:hypothetical protein